MRNDPKHLKEKRNEQHSVLGLDWRIHGINDRRSLLGHNKSQIKELSLVGTSAANDLVAIVHISCRLGLLAYMEASMTKTLRDKLLAAFKAIQNPWDDDVANNNCFYDGAELEPLITALIDIVCAQDEALAFYANTENWKDVWKDRGQESEDFKYFYMMRQRTDDFEKLKEPYHYYAGKRARSALTFTQEKLVPWVNGCKTKTFLKEAISGIKACSDASSNPDKNADYIESLIKAIKPSGEK